MAGEWVVQLGSWGGACKVAGGEQERAALLLRQRHERWAGCVPSVEGMVFKPCWAAVGQTPNP